MSALRLVLVALTTLSLAGAALGQEASSSVQVSAVIEGWSTVRINDVELEEPALIVRNEQGELYTRPGDLARWRLPFSVDLVTFRHRGEDLVRIVGRPGLDVNFQAETQQLDLKVDPWLLPEQRSGNTRPGANVITPSVTAAFGNYQIYATTAAGKPLSGSFDLGASHGRVSVLSGWLASQAMGGARRLDTALRIDIPEQRSHLLLGDAVGMAGASGRGWRFGGLQWSTDLDMAPQLPYFALPTARGVATVPSTVDLFVNGALIGSRDVAAGPFQIADIPVPTGSGTVMMRVRDAFGREQVIEQKFLATPLLLPAGMTTHAVEAGRLRYGYGSRSFEYGPMFTAASLHRGITPALTLETQVEFSGRQDTGRVAASMRLGSHLIAHVGAALSERDGSHGVAADASVDWQSRLLDLNVQARQLDARYTDLATPLASSRATSEWSAQLSPHLPFAGSMGLLYTRRDGAGKSSDVSVATLFASMSRVYGGSLIFQLSRVTAVRRDLRIGLNFVRALGGAQSTSVGVSHDARGADLEWQLGRTASRNTGWGWQLGARRGATEQYAARVEANSHVGSGNMELVRAADHMNLSGSWSGGWLWAANQLTATAPLTQGVAIVETPGIAGARITQDGQELGRTDRNGRLVATTLRAFELNQLRVDSMDVPVNAWIDEDTRTVAPYSHGVVHLRFETQASARTFTLRQPGGDFVPAGARVLIQEHSYPVGDNGRVSVPLAPGERALHATWEGQACEATLPLDNGNSVLELTCRGIML